MRRGRLAVVGHVRDALQESRAAHHRGELGRDADQHPRLVGLEGSLFDGLDDEDALEGAALDQRDAEEGMVRIFARLGEVFEARVGERIGHHDRPEFLGDEARQPLAGGHAHPADGLGLQADRGPQNEVATFRLEVVHGADRRPEPRLDQADDVVERLRAVVAMHDELRDLAQREQEGVIVAGCGLVHGVMCSPPARGFGSPCTRRNDASSAEGIIRETSPKGKRHSSWKSGQATPRTSVFLLTPARPPSYHRDMIAGYNTNGFAHHRLEDALTILAELGYGSVALTLDVHALDPFGDDLAGEVRRVRQTLQRHGLRCVIETGSRFLLDPRRKHQPTLMDPTDEGQACRLDFLRRAIDIATDLDADAVSFWSGTNEPEALATDAFSPSVANASGSSFQRLRDGCLRLCDHAERRQVRLAFEPEPGMFIDTMPRYRALFDAVAHPLFGLTLDIGHLVCMGEVPTAPHVLAWRDRLWNVHLEDMRPGVHDHLAFGEGATDFAEVFAGLHAANYAGGLHVELSRHSHDAVRTAKRSIEFLRPLIQ